MPISNARNNHFYHGIVNHWCPSYDCFNFWWFLWHWWETYKFFHIFWPLNDNCKIILIKIGYFYKNVALWAFVRQVHNTKLMQLLSLIGRWQNFLITDYLANQSARISHLRNVTQRKQNQNTDWTRQIIWSTKKINSGIRYKHRLILKVWQC